MRKFLALFFGLLLCGLLAPLSRAEESTDSTESTPEETLTAIAVTEEVTCPDPDAPLDFGPRADLMAMLQEKNPDLYNALVELKKARRKALVELCEAHPFLYQRLMERRQKALLHREQKLEKKMIRLEEKMEEKTEKMEERRAKLQEKICKKFPDRPGCPVSTDSSSDDVSDDSGEEEIEVEVEIEEEHEEESEHEEGDDDSEDDSSGSGSDENQ